jgi:hypothetical protein
MSIQLIKRALVLFLVAFSVFSLPGCWESDAENKAEDVIEKTEEMGDDAADSIEDAADNVGDKIEDAAQ